MRFVPRFSIRTLLLLILLFAGAAYWISREIKWELRKNQALARLREESAQYEDLKLLQIIPKPNPERTIAQRLLGDRASPPIEKFYLEHNSNLRREKFNSEAYANEQPWFDFSYVPELEVLSVHVQRNMFLIPTAKALGNLRRLLFELGGKLGDHSRDIAVMEQYLNALPDLPHLTMFCSEYDHYRPIMTGKQLVRLLKKAPNLTRLWVQLVDFDEATIFALQNARMLEDVSLNFWEPNEDRYRQLLTTLLKQPNLKHLRIDNEIERRQHDHRSTFHTPAEKALHKRILDKNQEIVIEHAKLEHACFTYAARIKCTNCPKLNYADVHTQTIRTECSNCPVAYSFPSNTQIMIVTNCPSLGTITDFNGERLELEGIKGMSQLWLPCLECLKTHSPIPVDELQIDPYVAQKNPQPDITAVSITGLKKVRLERLTPLTIQTLAQQKQIFNLLILAGGYSSDDRVNGWETEHCAALFEQAPLGDVEISSNNRRNYQPLISNMAKSSSLARIQFKEGEVFLETMFRSPQAAGVNANDFSDAALKKRCQYKLPKQLAHLRLRMEGRFENEPDLDEAGYKNRTLPLLQYLKRQYPQTKIDLAEEIGAYDFNKSDGCQEIELVPAPAAEAD